MAHKARRTHCTGARGTTDPLVSRKQANPMILRSLHQRGQAGDLALPESAVGELQRGRGTDDWLIKQIGVAGCAQLVSLLWHRGSARSPPAELMGNAGAQAHLMRHYMLCISEELCGDPLEPLNPQQGTRCRRSRDFHRALLRYVPPMARTRGAVNAPPTAPESAVAGAEPVASTIASRYFALLGGEGSRLCNIKNRLTGANRRIPNCG